MLRFVSVLLLVIAVVGLVGAIPAQAGLTVTQIQTSYQAAKERASCLTDAQRNTIRRRVALAYWEEAHHYLPDAVAHYRWYLSGVLHAIVTGQGNGCTRAVVAFFPNTRLGSDVPSVVFLTEEEFAQAQQGPIELSQGCCGNGYGNWSNGETGYGANLGGAGNGPCDASCLGAVGNTFGWAGIGAWGISQIGLGLAMLNATLSAPLSNPLTLTDLVMIGGALTFIGKGWQDLAGAVERASGGGRDAGDGQH